MMPSAPSSTTQPAANPFPSSSTFAAFRHRDYRLYQVARFLVIIGLEMQSVAVAWQVYEITRRPLDLGYVGLVQFMPGILLSLIVGHTGGP